MKNIFSHFIEWTKKTFHPNNPLPQTKDALPDQETSPLFSEKSFHISRSRRTNNKKQFTIAILITGLTPTGHEIVRGVSDYIKNHAPEQFTLNLFNGTNDEKRIITYATQIIQSHTMPYDAILTIGAMASQICSRISMLLNSSIPIIFTAVQNPVHLGIVYPGRRGKSHISGIAAPHHDHPAQLALLQSIKKDVRRILIPFTPKSTWFNLYTQDIKKRCDESNIESVQLDISGNNVTEKIEAHLDGVDTIIIPRDFAAMSNVENIIHLCNNNGITAYSSDLESVQHGVALGYSSRIAQMGAEGARYLLLMFQDQALPHELPIKTPKLDYILGINETNLKKQGVLVDQNFLNTIDRKVIFTLNTEFKSHK